MIRHREALAAYRAEFSRVFNVDPPPERKGTPTFSPEPSSRWCEPLPVEHEAGCSSTTVDSTVWTTRGVAVLQVSRCAGCSAETRRRLGS